MTTSLLNIPESWGERQRALSGEYGVKRDIPAVSYKLAMMAAAGIDPDSAADRQREINAAGERPMPGAVPLRDLLKHVDRH